MWIFQRLSLWNNNDGWDFNIRVSCTFMLVQLINSEQFLFSSQLHILWRLVIFIDTVAEINYVWRDEISFCLKFKLWAWALNCLSLLFNNLYNFYSSGHRLEILQFCVHQFFYKVSFSFIKIFYVFMRSVKIYIFFSIELVNYSIVFWCLWVWIYWALFEFWYLFFYKYSALPANLLVIIFDFFPQVSQYLVIKDVFILWIFSLRNKWERSLQTCISLRDLTCSWFVVFRF